MAVAMANRDFNNTLDDIVVAEDVHFARDTRPILQGLTLRIPRGKITAVMGPSGTGKTTILKLISGQLKPAKGSITINNINVHRCRNKTLYQLRREIGLLFQNGALFTNLTVFDNVAFPLREHTDLDEALIRDLVLMKLETVGLRGAAQLMPNELSGGMSRRVALARTIALDPKLLMYDEPFAGQDPISMGVIVKLIKQLNDVLGLTSIIVSHDVAETASIADLIYIVSGGKVIGSGTPEELNHSTDPDVQQFMQGLPDGPVPFHYPAPDYQEALLEEHGK